MHPNNLTKRDQRKKVLANTPQKPKGYKTRIEVGNEESNKVSVFSATIASAAGKSERDA